jgi:hypothetical protein
MNTPLNYENRGRRPRFPLKGGEEKSPYEGKFIMIIRNVLDAFPTITLRLFDN